jgi:hypothetical protein
MRSSIKAAVRSELLSEAFPEALRNMLLVLIARVSLFQRSHALAQLELSQLHSWS